MLSRPVRSQSAHSSPFIIGSRNSNVCCTCNFGATPTISDSEESEYQSSGGVSSGILKRKSTNQLNNNQNANNPMLLLPSTSMQLLQQMPNKYFLNTTEQQQSLPGSGLFLFYYIKFFKMFNFKLLVWLFLKNLFVT